MNTPEENVVKTLTGKKVLFLENDNVLQNGLDEFERILKTANIDYMVLFDLSNTPLETIITAINECDVIVFQTTWTYEISNKLFDYVSSLPDKKVVIEVYINEPTWYYASQHGTHHDVYIYTCMTSYGEVFKDSEKFFKLTDEPYWDYVNQFDE
jgi:hypothetical protein